VQKTGVFDASGRVVSSIPTSVGPDGAVPAVVVDVVACCWALVSVDEDTADEGVPGSAVSSVSGAT
jgi:hypothetical protein